MQAWPPRRGAGAPSCSPSGPQLTDVNAALFDARNGFAGCIAGLHEVLRRQGLLRDAGAWTPPRTSRRARAEEIDRVLAAYPHLTDDAFVGAHLDEWLR